jgi:three-Cys-motif partner protein
MSPERSDYVTREQAWVKHWLLERYLQRLIMKVGRHWGRIVYIDAFAGPWKSNKDDLSDTSFDRAVQVMRSCQTALAAEGVHRPFEALFLEKDKKRAAKLIEYAYANTSPEVKVGAQHKDFVDAIDDLASWIKDDDFAFILVDPTGFDGAAPALLAPLLRKRGVEVLINLMWDYVARFKTVREMGTTIEQIFGSDPAMYATENAARAHYCERLRQTSAAKSGLRLYATTFPVEYPDRDRTLYHLVYATHSPIGLLTFSEVAAAALDEQANTKAGVNIDRKAAKAGVADMFGAGELVKERRHVDEDACRRAWLTRMPVPGYEIAVDKNVMAELVEECMCMEIDLQASLKRLMSDGVVENLSATRGRPKNVVHWQKKERLRRCK